MNPVWRYMSFDDAICCIDAHEAAGRIRAQLSKFPESLPQILQSFSSDVTEASLADISSCIQISVMVLGPTLKSITSSEDNVHMLDQIFQSIAFGLARLLQEEASISD